MFVIIVVFACSKYTSPSHAGSYGRAVQASCCQLITAVQAVHSQWLSCTASHTPMCCCLLRFSLVLVQRCLPCCFEPFDGAWAGRVLPQHLALRAHQASAVLGTGLCLLQLQLEQGLLQAFQKATCGAYSAGASLWCV